MHDIAGIGSAPRAHLFEEQNYGIEFFCWDVPLQLVAQNILLTPISGERQIMKRRIIHQWRDWLLEYIGDEKYELIQKDDLSVIAIVAKDAMDAENQGQQIIKNTKKRGEGNTPVEKKAAEDKGNVA